MDIDFIWEGSSYISANLASEKTGYTSDYIGQLCRSRKIPCKMVGRTWFVDFRTLIRHKQSSRSGRAQRFRASKYDKALSISGKAAKTALNNRSLNYESDPRPLLPRLNKPNLKTRGSMHSRMRNNLVTLLLTLSVAMGTYLIVHSHYSKGVPTRSTIAIVNFSYSSLEGLFGNLWTFK